VQGSAAVQRSPAVQGSAGQGRTEHFERPSKEHSDQPWRQQLASNSALSSRPNSWTNSWTNPSRNPRTNSQPLPTAPELRVQNEKIWNVQTRLTSRQGRTCAIESALRVRSASGLMHGKRLPHWSGGPNVSSSPADPTIEAWTSAPPEAVTMSSEARLTWRGRFSSTEVNVLHAEAFETRTFTDQEWDWWALCNRHSLGWVVARSEDGKLVGFVNVVWDGSAHAWIQDVMVASQARGRSIGTRLVGAAADGSRGAGCEWLHVDFENDLRSFYFEACGFTPTNAGLISLQRNEVRENQPEQQSS
jgi:ribosomal protein S18 acetylase RimI-like enzyme